MTSCRSCASCERELSAVRLELQAVVRERDTAYDALREIERVLREDGPDDQAISAIGAIVSNGPLDTAPGGPREDECERLVRERDQYRDALEQIVMHADMPAGEPWERAYLEVTDFARAALSRERKDTNA